MTKTKLALFAGAMLAASPALAATNLLTNGSFESGLAGWSHTTSGVNSVAQAVSGTNDDAVGSLSPDAAGTGAVYFSTDTGTDTISQTVSLIAGHVYNLGYDYITSGYGNPYPFSMALVIGGTTVGTTDSSVPQSVWYTTNYSYTATATGNATFAFVFSGQGNPGRDQAIDRAYLLDTSAVPEPASWAMMIGGFGMIGAAMRQRRTAARLA